MPVEIEEILQRAKEYLKTLADEMNIADASGFEVGP
jgi:predicted RNA-binding protein Jag